MAKQFALTGEVAGLTREVTAAVQRSAKAS